MDISFHDRSTFDAKLSNLYQILSWITERLAKYLPQKDLERVELASEEVIVNIITHGYKKKKGTIQIEIMINESIELIFKDKSIRFNPLTKKNIHKPKKINKVGGVGLFIIFQCVDEVFYQRKDGYNILIFKVKKYPEY
jgi:serine/threonine-protein kinase RsbW